MTSLNDILEKAREKHELSKDEIEFLLQTDGEKLFKTADEIRKEYVGDEVHLRGLVEFSNICKSTCKYCGLRAPNKKIERYRLTPDEIINFANEGVMLGYKTLVLQSGEDMYYERDLLCSIISEIKKNDIALTLSIGERSEEDYEAFRTAGADRYLLRIETTDRNLYKKLHPNMDFENRLACLKNIKSLGYETGTGCLVGLPGQTMSSLADDILFFKSLNADMVGIGPFIPHPDTPLKGMFNPDNFERALKVMAVTRLVLPDINIPATTAMETVNPNGRIIALKSGANVVMPNILTSEYKKKYEIYPNKICINEHSGKCRNCIEAKINSIGRFISTTKGFRKPV
ncbi:MAG: [FeFe] hydrogenase H-cluster radical SAM maturase HydE [Candidatus Gastranaerophilales bacterium]|nr:[FeFe] hydrogenase H-cluster radical SAM maturase HydE [Candidatus Gastranaerophilales bacterium]